jgi:hypothetical protein
MKLSRALIKNNKFRNSFFLLLNTFVKINLLFYELNQDRTVKTLRLERQKNNALVF